jgi:hypothetical protein
MIQSKPTRPRGCGGRRIGCNYFEVDSTRQRKQIIVRTHRSMNTARLPLYTEALLDVLNSGLQIRSGYDKMVWIHGSHCRWFRSFSTVSLVSRISSSFRPFSPPSQKPDPHLHRLVIRKSVARIHAFYPFDADIRRHDKKVYQRFKSLSFFIDITRLSIG